jgi:3-hydroxyacyl-[acyl-carrier-protein] dehydratase
VRFILVDKILEFKKEKSIVAVKNVSLSDDFIVNHASLGLFLPHSYIVESIAQAAGWLLTASFDFKKRALLVTLGTLEFNGFVHPGDRLMIEAEIESLQEEAGMVKGRAKVGDNVVVEIESSLCALINAEQLDDPEKTRDMFSIIGG